MIPITPLQTEIKTWTGLLAENTFATMQDAVDGKITERQANNLTEIVLFKTNIDYVKGHATDMAGEVLESAGGAVAGKIGEREAGKSKLQSIFKEGSEERNNFNQIYSAEATEIYENVLAGSKSVLTYWSPE